MSKHLKQWLYHTLINCVREHNPGQTKFKHNKKKKCNLIYMLAFKVLSDEEFNYIIVFKEFMN